MTLPVSLLIIYSALLGLVVGSFLNVVVHRLPRGTSIVFPRSACTFCGGSVAARDNVPVLSYLILRGKCRRCSAPISIRYPLVEIATSGLFALCAWRFGFEAQTLVAIVFCCLLLCLALIDLDHFLLPDKITLPGILIGLGLQTWFPRTSLSDAILGVLLGAGVLILIINFWYWLREEEGMGLGDVNMLAMIGAFLGWQGAAVALVAATIAGASTGLVLISLRRLHARSRLPFGVFLSLGAGVALFAGEKIADFLSRIAMKSASTGSGIGLRREVMIVIPVVFLLLVVLSTYTLFSYRSGIAMVVETQQAEAARLAGQIAESVAAGEISSARELRARVPHANYFVFASSDGRSIFEGGSISTGSPFSDFEGLTIESPTAIGPDPSRSYIAAIAPTVWHGQRHYVRFDLRAIELARQLTNVRWLSWVVLPINAALSALVLLFLRHLLAPYDKLLAVARRLQAGEHSSEDEVAFLITSFERAIRAIEAEESPEGDLATLELALGPSLESGFLLLGRNGNVLALNPVGAQLLGEPIHQPGTSMRELLSGQPRLGQLVTAAVESNQPIQRQEVEINRNGETVTLGLSVHPLRRDDGEVRGFLALFADLTETRRKAQEERISFSLTQVGELAAGVAHEMRNSLSTFRGYLTLIDRAPEEEAITDYLLELRRETDHLQRVLEDFLSFARPESTRPESLRLDSVVHRAAVDPALEGSKVEIESGGPLPVRGDAQLLERAIRNLLHNACQAQDTAGVSTPITVRTSRRERMAVIEILDRGPGLPRDVRDRLFEPFVTSRSGGVGLGLSLARRIIDLHGGHLRLVDRAGGGTLAEMTIALEGKTDAPAPVPSPQPNS